MVGTRTQGNIARQVGNFGRIEEFKVRQNISLCGTWYFVEDGRTDRGNGMAFRKTWRRFESDSAGRPEQEKKTYLR